MGDAGVGGGGFGGTSRDDVVDSGESESCGEPLSLFFDFLTAAVSTAAASSVSVSDPLRASSSQLSATGLLFGFCSGFSGCEGDSCRLPRVLAISEYHGFC